MFNKFKQAKTDVTENMESDHEEGLEVLTAKVPSSAGLVANAAQKPSIIGEGAVYEGTLLFNGTLHLDGQFKGSINVDKLTIGKSGRFNGKIVADTVVVFGELKGELDCKDLALNSGSNIDGVINYASIKVQPGSSISGELICAEKKNAKN